MRLGKLRVLKTASVLCFTLIAIPAAGQVVPNFKGDFQSSELRFGAGEGPVSAAIGDFNEDGRPDLAVADYDGNTISVVLGNGDGTFGNATTYPAGDYPYGIAVADVNGDGHLDIVCTNLNLDHLTLGGTISVFLGRGDGTFAAAVNYIAGKNLSSLVLADFNSDGKIDVATADVSSGNVVILLNNGDGTFQTGVPYPAGPYPFSLGTADFNADGNPDLVVSNFCDVSLANFTCTPQQTTVTVLLGRGNGTFAGPASYQAGPSPFNLVVKDLNGDGKYDVAVSAGPFSATNASVFILLGNGDGTFQAPTSYQAPGSMLAVGDFSSNGTLDLIQNSANGLAELAGTGAGSFYAPVKYFVPFNFSELGNALVGDLNGDGLPDVIIPDQGVLGVFLNAGALTRESTAITLSSSQNPVEALSALSVTASVTPSQASLQGSVTFYLDGQTVIVNGASPPLGQLNSTSQATFVLFPSNALTPLTPGTHSITAIYSGDTTTEGSTSNTVMQTVTAIPSTVTLSSSLNPSLTGQTVTFTAATAPHPNAAALGSVTFFDGTSPLGASAVVDTESGFVATLSVSILAVGTHSITASYVNNPYFAPSVSAALQQIVNANLNFTVANGAQSSATIAAGSTAQYALAIGDGGFSGPVTLSCSGAPTGAICSVTPSSLMVSGTSASTVNVSVTTTPRSSALFGHRVRPFLWFWIALLSGLPMLLGSRGKAKSLLAWPLFAALLIAGCGGGSASTGNSSGNASANPGGTPAGNYTLTVAANSGSASQSVSLTLTVQ